jgi:hypothetical protein
MDVNRISGYIPGKIVFFLMQVGGSQGDQIRVIWTIWDLGLYLLVAPAACAGSI